MRRNLILLATLGCLGLVVGAYGFQYIGGLAPCDLCWTQRYGHFVGILAGVAALFALPRVFSMIAGGGALFSGIVAIYHTGVERHWWAGPDSCTSNPVTGLSTDDLLNQIMSAPLVRCDEIPWQMFGLSMANYNIVASFGLAAIFFYAASLKRQ